MDPWPFDQPKNVACFTLWRVLNREDPILDVYHDAADGAWQFLSDKPATMKDAALVALEEIVELDHTILQLADLPEGWRATRSDPKAPWVRGPYEAEEG